MSDKIVVDMQNADFKPSLNDPYSDEEIEQLTSSTPFDNEIKIADLEVKVEALNLEIEILNRSIVMLKEYIQENGLKAFGSDDLQKRPSEMTKEELIERNKKSKPVPRAKSSEALAQPSLEELMKMYTPKGVDSDSRIDSIEEFLLSNAKSLK